jgi:hypothetical protein
MIFMCFFILRVYQYVVDEYQHKQVEEFHEYFIHQVHKVSWYISQSKRHDQKLIESISCSEGRFRYIFSPNLQLMIA